MDTLRIQDVKAMMLPDLRTACRDRGLSPAGARDTLQDRLYEYLGAVAQGLVPASMGRAPGGQPGSEQMYAESRGNNNNYARADGQNIGNFITDRPSSHVSAPPGGASQLGYLFSGGEPAAPAPQHHRGPQQPQGPSPYGWGGEAPAQARPLNGMQKQPLPYMHPEAVSQRQHQPQMSSNPLDNLGQGHHESRGNNNNYARADGQNLGNFITDKPSSRVLAEPGGASSLGYLFGGK